MRRRLSLGKVKSVGLTLLCDREIREAERLMPDGTWVCSMRTREIFDGRPLEDEKDALDTASFLVARNKEREAAKRGRS